MILVLPGQPQPTPPAGTVIKVVPAETGPVLSLPDKEEEILRPLKEEGPDE